MGTSILAVRMVACWCFGIAASAFPVIRKLIQQITEAHTHHTERREKSGGWISIRILRCGIPLEAGWSECRAGIRQLVYLMTQRLGCPRRRRIGIQREKCGRPTRVLTTEKRAMRIPMKQISTVVREGNVRELGVGCTGCSVEIINSSSDLINGLQHSRRIKYNREETCLSN